MTDRRQDSYSFRVEAAELARSRVHPTHEANGEEQRYSGASFFMSFTKGLPHHPDTGLVSDPVDFLAYRRAIDEGFIDPFTDRVRHGARFETDGGGVVTAIPDANVSADFRQWEAPTAGTVFELQGPDPQAVTMPPAPPLTLRYELDGGNLVPVVNPELVFEMAEVYELAVLRDVPLNAFEAGRTTPTLDDSIGRLNALPYVADPAGRPRIRGAGGQLDAQTVHRGSSPGVELGPYLSQFMLIGTRDVNGSGSVRDGQIQYGVLNIDQRVPEAEQTDFMLGMNAYVCVQRGLRPAPEQYVADGSRPRRRFITTPRDLATYVHYDALYEAYLNAALILLDMGTPTDPAFDQLSGGGFAAGDPGTRRHAGGFALFGGPHILTLVTEVATRALKAVRYQKFNNHIRLRPEALAARVELSRRAASTSLDVPQLLLDEIAPLRAALEGNGTLGALAGLGTGANEGYFLPMAFPEGSPMHPAYGAGHATVAGACVTILKAYFDTGTALYADHHDLEDASFRHRRPNDVPVQFRAPVNDADPQLERELPPQALTLEGELNKLAANISIGRNMAGVHYFSDYYDSLRMGEAIAIGMLEEQALGYVTDPYVLSVPTFDGEVVRIGRR